MISAIARAGLLVGALFVAPSLAFAQSAPSSSGCEATPGPSATPPAQGENSGTAPGGAGSTAWSGGTGGSYIGTSPSQPTSKSPTDHPPTVQGVNPSVVGPVRKDC